MTDSKWTRRDFFRRSAGAAAAVVGGPALVGACSRAGTGGDPLSQAREQGSITIGIAGEAPYGFTDKQGNVTGEAAEVARAVFENLDIPEIQAEQTDFGSLIPGLNAGQFATVAAGMYITPDRCANAAFSIPDYTAPTAFLVPEGNPENVTRFEDIIEKNLNLAVLGGAVEKGYAEDLGVPSNQMQIYDSQNALLQAVADERAYCAALTDISLTFLVKQSPEANVEVTEGFTPVIDGEERVQAGAFAFRPGDDQLREAFNRELRNLHQEGRWLEIASQFTGFGEKNVPPEDLRTQELCQPEETASPTNS